MSCFDEITARALAAGQLRASESSPLRRHAEACRKCAQLLARVTPPGTAAQRTAVARDIVTDTATAAVGHGEDDTLPTEPIRVGNRPAIRLPSPPIAKDGERTPRHAVRQTQHATHQDVPSAEAPGVRAAPPAPA
ncbi:serine/threonine protein kinase, partial [Myxococcus sp. 1LA]